MLTNRLFNLFVFVAVLLGTACSSQITATDNAPTSPIILRLAVADEEGDPSAIYVHELAEQVKTLSKGNITIEPTWDAGSTTQAGFETGVIQLVKEGKFDLGLAASRAFDNENITSFQALQAPFLIDNDALAIAVAQSDVVLRMLESLSSSGLVGITLWPEDLRHPFSLTPGKPLLSPGDFAGLNIRTVPSSVSNMMVEALGGKPMFEDNTGYEGAESGLRQGAHLTGTPTVTGNVTFFAKYQVLFANGSTFEKLSETQRAILEQAAVALQKKAITEHPGDVEVAKAWCADGGSIVLASDEQVAAFQVAVQPIFDKLQQDSFNAESIVALKELKTNTQPSAGAQACVPTTSNPAPVSVENQVWSQGLPPNGVWQVELFADDFVRMGVLRSKAEAEWVGTYTLTFQDNKYKFDYQGTSGLAFGCEADLVLENDVVKAIYTSGENCKNGVDYLQWRQDADGLHLHLVSIKNAPYLENKAFYEAKPWQNIILNGTWDYVVSDEDARQFFLKDYGVTANEVRIRYGFNNDQWYQVAVFDGEPFLLNGVPEGDLGTFRIEGDRLIQESVHGETLVYAWYLDGDQLALTILQECIATSIGLKCRDDKSKMDPIMILVTEHTYTKSGDDGSY